MKGVGVASYMAAEQMEADVGVPPTAARWRWPGPVRSGSVRATSKNQVEDGRPGTKSTDEGCEREQRRLLTTTGTE